MTVRVAQLEYSDLPRVAELERRLFAGDDPWSESTLRAELDHGNHYLGAYADDGRLVGYAGIAVVGSRMDAEASVHTIGVDPDWQGSGVGRALLDGLLAVADEFRAPVHLEVRTDNARAIALYRAHGFTTIGRRRRYYQPSGADAFTMTRPARVTEEGR